MNKEIKDLAKGKGIPVSIFSWIWKNLDRIEELLQIIKYIRDKYKGENVKTFACGPRPAPKLEPGYWECVSGEWTWVPAV